MTGKHRKGAARERPAKSRGMLLMLLIMAIGIAAWALLSSGEPEVAADDGRKPTTPITYRATIVSRLEHDRQAYTQGLEFIGDELVESTGLYGGSTLRRYSPFAEGERERIARLPSELFGEGLTLVGDRIIQLTWKEGVALVYDATSMSEIERWHYQGEGWGLCFDGSVLFMSDGSDRLQRRDPQTFAPLGELEVSAPWPVTGLNELECAEP